MLKTELIDLINGGKVWAFVGSGVSCDSGLPSWPLLLTKTIRGLHPDARAAIEADPSYLEHVRTRAFPNAFSRVAKLGGRTQMEASLRAALAGPMQTGPLVNLLASWPFEGYITTNYDNLIEQAMSDLGQQGWVPVGNKPDECRKLSGDATDLVWHLHGSAELDESKSKFIITEEDYDSLYDGDTPAHRRLRALLSQKRLLFVGFGFADFEVNRILRSVGGLCSPARPAYAIVGETVGLASPEKRLEFLERFNVEIIPYRIRGDKHDELVSTARVYNSFILGRALQFGKKFRPCPAYDPDTTSLYLYNELVLSSPTKLADVVISTLCKARILALLCMNAEISITALEEDFTAHATPLIGSNGGGDPQTIAYAIEMTLSDLVREGLISRVEQVIGLTEFGKEKVAHNSAHVALLNEQFRASLSQRLVGITDDGQRQRIASVTETFLLDSVKKRALGVSQSLNLAVPAQQSFQITALLQSLPEYMQHLDSSDEAGRLIATIIGILTRPSEPERKFLGATLQAQFSITLLGYDPQLIRARLNLISETVFVIDASMLLWLMARSSPQNDASWLLISKMQKCGATIVTTSRIVGEVAEHIRWALDRIPPGSPQDMTTLAMVTGVAGYSANVFLQGFMAELQQGAIAADFRAYLDSACKHPRAHEGTDDAIQKSLALRGISSADLADWRGYKQQHSAEMDVLRSDITRWREEQSTYRHERQVEAEAEAVLIVEKVRAGEYDLGHNSLKDAYFLSNSRFLDRANNYALPITIRPQSTLQLLNTLIASSDEELAMLFDGLISELDDRGFSVVDKVRMQQTFSPLISAAKEDLAEVLQRHQALIATRYGEQSAQAFRDIPDIYVPVAFASLNLQRAEAAEKKLRIERTARIETQRASSLAEKEREELNILRQQKKARKAAAKAKKRAAQSKPKAKRKKR